MTRPAFRPAFYPAFRSAFNKLKSISAAVRSVYNFDGIDDRGQFAFRAINPDGDIDIEWFSGQDANFSTSRTVVSQTLTTTAANQEFFMFVATNGNLAVRVGGVERGTNPAIVYQPNTKYRWRLQGTTVNLWINDVPQPAMTLNRGTAREASATTQVGVAVNTFFYRGQLSDIKINGILYPIADRNQSIQLPLPAGLGAELITKTVLENPSSKGSQWTYLGGGRWQYVGDGSFNEMVFITNGAQPENGFLEFEVESISGNMRCYTTISGVGTLQSNPRFNSVGLFRYYYNSKASLGGNSNFFSFFRDGTGMVSSCILKNISFKPLGSLSASELGATRVGSWFINSATNIVNSSTEVRKTTEDIPVTPNTAYQISPIGGTSDRSRWQYRKQSDNTWVWGADNFDRTAAQAAAIGVLFTPNDCNALRIYFCSEFATATSLSIRKLDSLCNPLTLINTTPERWQEVPL